MKEKLKQFYADHKDAIVIGLAGTLVISAYVAHGRRIDGGGMAEGSDPDVFLVKLKNGKIHDFHRPNREMV